MRAGVYVRISNDQEGLALGVGRQEEDCRKLADRLGWDVAEVYTDNDVSAGGKRKRPGWEQLLADLESGFVEAVLAYSSSRMYRRVSDLTRLIDLANDHVPIATVVSGNIDLSTADGRMMARILASVDEGELERVSERQRRKRAQLRAQGRWTGGNVPFGYRPVDGRLEPYEPEAALLREAAAAVVNGVSIRSIMLDWNVSGKGGKRWTQATLKGMLLRPNPGIIAEPDAERIQALFESRRIPAGAKPRSLLSGMLICGKCSGRMRHRRDRYVCDSPNASIHLGIRAEPLERLVLRWALLHEAQADGLIDPSEPLLAERGSLVEQMEELGASDLPLPTLKARAAKLQAQVDEIDDQLLRTNVRRDPTGTVSNFAALMGPGVSLFEPVILGGRERGEVRGELRIAVRAHLETLIESILVKPSSNLGATKFDPDRVIITPRDGVLPLTP